MADAPTPEPSAAEVLAKSLEEWHDEWAGEPFTYTAIAAMQVAALDAAGYEIVRRGAVESTHPDPLGRCGGCGAPMGSVHYTGCLMSTSVIVGNRHG